MPRPRERKHLEGTLTSALWFKVINTEIKKNKEK